MKEIAPLSGGKMTIHLQRHDNHHQGHLTPEGIENARKIAIEKANSILNENTNTNFMVVASDQLFDEREPGFGGLRAKETADVIISVIKDELIKRELHAEHLFGIYDIPVTLSPDLREAGIFSNGFMNHLRSQYPDDNQWSIYYQDTEAKTREAMKAESPLDLAIRMRHLVEKVETVGASFHKAEGKENVPLVVWVVGHGGGLDSYLHQYANVPISELGFPVSGGFTICADSELGVVAEVKGKRYPIKQD